MLLYYYHPLFYKPMSDLLLQVVEAASRKDLPPGSPSKEGKVMVDNLKKNIQQFASDIDAFTDNAALLQVSGGQDWPGRSKRKVCFGSCL